MPTEFLEGEFELRAKNSSAIVSPWGASLMQLSINDREVIAHGTARAAREAYFGVTLAPWPNRLAGGSWLSNGKKLSSKLNDHLELGDEANANHGLVFERKFEIVNHTDNSALFRIFLGDDSVYPFKLELDVQYVLSDDQVEVTISAINLSDQKVPIAFGSHPYISVEPNSTINIPATTETINNTAQIPIGKQKSEKIRVNGSAPTFQQLQLDDCFTDLVFDERGIATTEINNPDGSKINLWQSEAFKYLMVYTHRELAKLGVPVDAIALEPQTAPANALNSEEGLIWLEPNEVTSANWGIRVKKSR